MKYESLSVQRKDTRLLQSLQETIASIIFVVALICKCLIVSYFLLLMQRQLKNTQFEIFKSLAEN